MSDKTQELMDKVLDVMKGKYQEADEETCIEAFEDEVYNDVTFIGYSEEIATEVARTAANKLRELSGAVYVRKHVEDGLTEEEQKQACEKAAEEAGYVVLK